MNGVLWAIAAGLFAFSFAACIENSKCSGRWEIAGAFVIATFTLGFAVFGYVIWATAVAGP